MDRWAADPSRVSGRRSAYALSDKWFSGARRSYASETRSLGETSSTVTPGVRGEQELFAEWLERLANITD